tara:strand:+ start:2180 stop:2407 length:228 start_codon:yes stop_codon:yes gene_type:complete
VNEDDYAMHLAFDKNKADDRKEWLSNYNEKTDFVKYENNDNKIMSYSDSINKELINFSISDTYRSIPYIDGLKTS